MTGPERAFHHAANALVAGTGLVYAWMIYAIEPEDPFALVNHPWQGELQSLHILFAPLLVFAVGLSWQTHVWMRLRFGFPHKRRTGLCLVALFLPMVLSGYGLQVAVSESARTTWLWTHWISSGLWVLCYVVHRLLPGPADLADLLNDDFDEDLAPEERD